MKNKKNILCHLLIILAGVVYFPVRAQQKKDINEVVEKKDVPGPQGPGSITRNVIQDKKGNIWLASWEGIFRYDGKSFTNITSKVSSARFFAVFEDRKGDFWFASIGSGIYHYNGKSFKNFTVKDGLASDRVTNIYEDKTGKIWFGTEGGASLYDGKSFRDFKMKESSVAAQTDSVHVSAYQNGIPENSWMHNDVNAILEDKTGKLWFATRGYAFVYDGKTFTTITNKEGKPFVNVRSVIKDKKGNIWLGGSEGLWRYDGSTFTNYTRKFVGYVYEDRKGNIWTGSESPDNLNRLLAGPQANKTAWVLSRYDEKSLSGKKPTVKEIAYKPMVFGILEDEKGIIWFGSVDGVHRYDGNRLF